MFKSFLILFLLVAVTISSACQTPSRCSPPPPCSLPANEFDPSQLLSQLRQESQPFAHFYEDKIAPLGYTIRWFHNLNLPPGEAVTCVYIKDHSAIIELGNTSPNDDVAFLVAHELAGVVTIDGGYFLGYSSQCEEIGGYLFDMILTPLRDSMLAEYGFNATKEFDLRVKPVFSSACGEINHPIVQLANACLYVQLILYWQDVLGNHSVPSDVENRYLQCSPESLARGKAILAIINEVGGYDTPAKAKEIFQRIIREYNLEYCACVS